MNVIHNPQNVPDCELPDGYRFAFVNERLTPGYRYRNIRNTAWYAGGGVGYVIMGGDRFSHNCTCCVLDNNPQYYDVEIL